MSHDSLFSLFPQNNCIMYIYTNVQCMCGTGTKYPKEVSSGHIKWRCICKWPVPSSFRIWIISKGFKSSIYIWESMCAVCFSMSVLLHSEILCLAPSMYLWVLHFIFFLIGEYFFIVCMFHIFMIHLSVEEYLGCFHFLAVVTGTVMTKDEQVSLVVCIYICVCVCVYIHTYISIHIYPYTHAYIHTCI